MIEESASFNSSIHRHDEDIFNSLTVNVSVCTIQFSGVNIGPMGQALKKYNPVV